MENTFYRAVSGALRALARIDSRVGMKTFGTQQLHELHDDWLAYVNHVISNHAPSGSGFDNGAKLNHEMSSADKLVFVVPFQHMSAHGFYDGRSDHQVVARPGFDGVSVRVTGRDRNGIKDYIAEQFITLDIVVVPTYGQWLSSRRVDVKSKQS